MMMPERMEPAGLVGTPQNAKTPSNLLLLALQEAQEILLE
jgi:hypothetical protein